MNRTGQKHVIEYKKLPDADSWSAKDAAGLAINAAELAHKYYGMTKDTVNDIRGDIDGILLAHNLLEKKVRGMEAERRSIVNQAILYGAASAIVMSVAWGLIAATFSTPSPSRTSIERGVAK
jgi:hypothetical protein